MVKALQLIGKAILVGFVGWFALSYVDVLMHNMSGGTDASWNFFNVFIK